MDPTIAATLVVLGALWLGLLVVMLWGERPPGCLRMGAFLAWLAVSAGLAYLVLVGVFEVNPNPYKISLARRLTDDKVIYLGDIVPGLYDLHYIERIDTDKADEEIKEEWLAFYQYDVKEEPAKGEHVGPYGAAIYDYDGCRPPAILSYELVPASYDYLAQDAVAAEVQNIIAYQDPISGYIDWPEVLIKGSTRDVVTDLNIFRKTGVALDCRHRLDWQSNHPGQAFPNPFRYQNIGSFRGSYQVSRSGSTVTVIDRGGFERSQLVVKSQYRPENGSYFQPGTQTLLKPVERSLDFGPGQPDQVTQVYYPEKAVLAFYLSLGKDSKKLEQARSYLSPDAQAAYDIWSDPFGLSTDPNGPAPARDELARVLVLEIRYQPDIAAEQMHKDRQVRVTVVGVNKDGFFDEAHRCDVTWAVVGEPKAGALPYGCEWRLDRYQTSCPPPP